MVKYEIGKKKQPFCLMKCVKFEMFKFPLNCLGYIILNLHYNVNRTEGIFASKRAGLR